MGNDDGDLDEDLEERKALSRDVSFRRGHPPPRGSRAATPGPASAVAAELLPPLDPTFSCL